MVSRTDQRNVGAMHDGPAATDPDRVALVDGETGDEYRYAELAALVNRASNVFDDHGVTPGDRVPLLFDNSIRYPVVLFGAIRAGAVPVPVNWRLPRPQIEHVLDDCGGSVAVLAADPAVRETAVPAIRNTDEISIALVDGATDCAVGDTERIGLGNALEAAADTYDPVSVTADDPALQPYTSGSTGRPKGVVLTHGGVSWNVNAFVDHLSLDATERALVVTPLYHKNAMSGAIKPMIRTGGSTVILDEGDPQRALACIERYDVTYVTGVPVVFKRLVAAARSGEGRDLGSLEWVSCGSATVPESLADDIREVLGAELLEVYGLTEGGPVVTHTPREGPRKRGSAGRPLPGVETRVVDPGTGRECQRGEPGELLVSNPGVGAYVGQDVGGGKYFYLIDGRQYRRTGDLVHVDDDGYHFVHGRLDEMINVGGENVYPAEVEEVLQRHAAVLDVAVVPVPHAEKGSAPVAFVVTDGPASEADLQSFALERGPAYAHPRRVFLRDSLPETGTGKCDRDALAETARLLVDDPL